MLADLVEVFGFSLSLCLFSWNSCQYHTVGNNNMIPYTSIIHINFFWHNVVRVMGRTYIGTWITQKYPLFFFLRVLYIKTLQNTMFLRYLQKYQRKGVVAKQLVPWTLIYLRSLPNQWVSSRQPCSSNLTTL